jgi:hypothetical protein
MAVPREVPIVFPSGEDTGYTGSAGAAPSYAEGSHRSQQNHNANSEKLNNQQKQDLLYKRLSFSPYEKVAVLVIDIQPVYYSQDPEVSKHFPDLEDNVSRALHAARATHFVM